MKEAIVIPLDFWKDPQGDVILIFSGCECSVYFGCWSAAGEPADFIGHLSFEKASKARSFNRELLTSLPYRVPKNHGRSCIFSIPDSDFLQEYIAYRKAWDSFNGVRSNACDRVHYVVPGHDTYHEILAAGFTATTIPKREVTDARLRRLIGAA